VFCGVCLEEGSKFKVQELKEEEKAIADTQRMQRSVEKKTQDPPSKSEGGHPAITARTADFSRGNRELVEVTV
jgi:hypothetical protein